MLALSVHARRQPKGTLPDAQKLQEINAQVNTLVEMCKGAIIKYSRPNTTMERNCYLLRRFRKFLARKGCTDEDFAKLSNVLMCQQ
jgi:hypothetical protein